MGVWIRLSNRSRTPYARHAMAPKQKEPQWEREDVEALAGQSPSKPCEYTLEQGIAALNLLKSVTRIAALFIVVASLACKTLGAAPARCKCSRR